MKHLFKTTTLIALSLAQFTVINSGFCAGKTKKEEAKKTTSKELAQADKATSVASSAKNMSMEISADTAYYNGKAVLLQIPFTNEKHNKYFTVSNLNGEKIAFIEVGTYLNGMTFYNVNYLATNQSTYGGMYESTGEFVELLAQNITDGKLTAGNVIKLAKENKLELKNNVVFKYPALKSPLHKAAPQSLPLSFVEVQ